MKHAILLVSSLALLSLVPAASADVSILGGTVVVHTTGDPGVSVLGESVARVFSGPCPYNPSLQCVIVYGYPGGLGVYEILLANGSCSSYNGAEICAGVGVIPPAGLAAAFVVYVGESQGWAGVCIIPGDCAIVETDPLCISDNILGEIVCST